MEHESTFGRSYSLTMSEALSLTRDYVEFVGAGVAGMVMYPSSLVLWVHDSERDTIAGL